MREDIRYSTPRQSTSPSSRERSLRGSEHAAENPAQNYGDHEEGRDRLEEGQRGRLPDERKPHVAVAAAAGDEDHAISPRPLTKAGRIPAANKPAIDMLPTMPMMMRSIVGGMSVPVVNGSG